MKHAQQLIPPYKPRVAAMLQQWPVESEIIVEVDDALVSDVDFTQATRININASRMQRVTLTGAILEKLELTDVVCDRIEGAALGTYKANLFRVGMTDCRFTGAEFAESYIEDCLFRNVKFDGTGFRFAAFKRVRFEQCIVRGADFSNAKLAHVTFSGCDFEATNFTSATCNLVDISSEDILQVKGLLGLKGATISAEQLIQLAPLLASELGFEVKE
jgi:uncharacterized protein YjbI with pentapeptide repeats